MRPSIQTGRRAAFCIRTPILAIRWPAAPHWPHWHIFAHDDVLNANRAKAEYLNRIALPLRDHPSVKNWRNTGMIWAFEVDSQHADFAQRCFSQGLQHELLLRPMGNTVYFMPPYIISEAEMQYLIDRTLHIIDQLS